MQYKRMCILTDNVADRAAITVSNTAPLSGAENLKTDIKGQVCRVLSDSAEIELTWPELTGLGVVVLPVTNLGPSSTIRVRAYHDEEGTVLLEDTGERWAAPGAVLENWGFTQPLNANQFAFTLPPVTSVYFSQHVSARKLVISIENPGESFIDISRLVVGPYFTPNTNPSYDQADSIVDMSKNTRTASGDIKTDLGPKAKAMTFSLGNVDPAHRAQVRQIMEMGIGRFMFISLTPDNTDPELERDKSIYGKVGQPLSMRWATYRQHTAEFNIEGF